MLPVVWLLLLMLLLLQLLLFHCAWVEYFAGIFTAFRFYAVTMTTCAVPLVARFEGHEKRTDND